MAVYGKNTMGWNKRFNTLRSVGLDMVSPLFPKPYFNQNKVQIKFSKLFEWLKLIQD